MTPEHKALVEALERIRDANPQSTNTVSAEGAFAYTRAVAAAAIESLSQSTKGEGEGEQEAVKDAGSKLAKAVWGIDLVQKGDKA